MFLLCARTAGCLAAPSLLRAAAAPYRTALAWRVCAPADGWRGWLRLALALALVAIGPFATAIEAPPPPTYHFRQGAADSLLSPPADLLDADERAFLAKLPAIRVGLNLPDNRPYEVIDGNGEISGIQIEILTHVALALGLRLEPVVVASFPDALKALQQRRIDMMSTVGYEPSRKPYMAYTLGTAPNPGVIIGREADNRFDAMASLNGRRVAIERDYIAAWYVRRTYPDALVSEHPDSATALRAVALGEDDFYVGSLLMATDRIQREHITGLAVKRAMLYATGQMHFGVRSDWPLLASALSKGVAVLRASPQAELRSMIGALVPHASGVPLPLLLSQAEQRQLANLSVLRVGAVRGQTLINEPSAEGGHSGLAADYLSQVIARLGLTVDIVPFDSVAQMRDALREGSIHMVPFLGRASAGDDEFAFSAPYVQLPYSVIARSDAPQYWSLDGLRGRRLALTAQHPLRDMLRTRWPDITLVEAATSREAVDMVLDQRADAAVDLQWTARLRINADPSGRLRQVARAEELPGQFHFAFNRALAPLLPLFDRALDDIAPTERTRLLQRWLAVEPLPGIAWQRWLPWLAAAGATLLLGGALTAWWMRRLSREVRRRRLAEARMRDIANGLPGVVFQYVLDVEGRVEQRYVSEAIEAFLGAPFGGRDSLFGALTRFSAADEVLRLRAAIEQAWRERTPLSHTLRVDDPHRGPRWLYCAALPRRLPAERVSWNGQVVDVSSERALHSKLVDAVQAKNLFVANASHELRAPLHGIALALQQLGESRLDDPQRTLWRLALDGCDALLLLVDDMLDLTRLESGRLPLRLLPVQPAQLLGEIVAQHRLAAERRGLALQLTLADDLPPRARLDALRLRQTLGNLIGNAIKYTAAGGRVEVAGRVTDHGHTLLLSVRDSGVGIAPERQHALFEPFETLHGAGSAAPEHSSGLGLAICKRLVQTMNGSIALTSSPGVGTEVVVRLPLPPLALAPLAPRNGQVLVVDDDPISRLLMATMLRNDGFAVAEASDGQAALALWRSSGAAAVVTDRHMPGIDGTQLLATIAAEAAAGHGEAPFGVLCTGDVPDANSLPAAVDRVLVKPVAAVALRETLRELGVVAAPAAPTPSDAAG